MSKGFRVKGKGAGGTGNYNGPKIDWECITEQVEEGTQAARISQIWDLGLHKDEVKLGTGSETEFASKAEAEDFIEEMREKYGESHEAFNNEPTITRKGGKFAVKLGEYGGVNEYQEVAIVLDFPEMLIDWEAAGAIDIGTKPYRHYLNPIFQGNLRGFQMKAVAPNSGDVWSFNPKSQLAKLAVATRKKEILEDKESAMDISLMLGEALNVALDKTDKGYVKVVGFTPLKVKRGEVEEVEELPTAPLLIQFDDVTVETLIEAMPRKALIDKIKAASDYSGSKMEEAVEAYEEYLQSRNSQSKSKTSKVEDEDEDLDEYQDDEEEQPKRGNQKVARGSKAQTKSRQTKQVDEDEDDGFDDEDDDLPF